MAEPLGRHLVNGKQMNVHSCKQTDGGELPEEVNDAKQADACLAQGKPILAPEQHGI